ncbi:CidA/LrgA family protein [Vibrio intestinalis]|uniref:CidA/LrgA family protein n=1 Tax=Vibrio intestinalis TaxID=2933291 RepID=UPI0021A3A397|nr:CidA/LrgA family protein [Vibrio intestinalis]
MAKNILRYAVSMGLVSLCLLAGINIQHLLETSIPGSIIGMMILFGLMTSGLVPSDWIRPSANLFIRYMVLFFVPVSVGIIDHFDMLISNATNILITTVGGTLIVLVITGLILQHLLDGGNK